MALFSFKDFLCSILLVRRFSLSVSCSSSFDNANVCHNWYFTHRTDTGKKEKTFEKRTFKRSKHCILLYRKLYSFWLQITLSHNVEAPSSNFCSDGNDECSSVHSIRSYCIWWFKALIMITILIGIICYHLKMICKSVIKPQARILGAREKGVYVEQEKMSNR